MASPRDRASIRPWIHRMVRSLQSDDLSVEVHAEGVDVSCREGRVTLAHSDFETFLTLIETDPYAKWVRQSSEATRGHEARQRQVIDQAVDEMYPTFEQL